MPLVGRIGPDVEACDDGVALLGDEPEGDGAVEPQRRQGPVDVDGVDRIAEGGGGRRRGSGHPTGRQRLLASEGGARQGAEDVEDARDREVGCHEIGAQQGDEALVEVRDGCGHGAQRRTGAAPAPAAATGAHPGRRR